MTPKDTKKMQARIDRMLREGNITKGKLTTLYQAAYGIGYREGKKHGNKA